MRAEQTDIFAALAEAEKERAIAQALAGTDVPWRERVLCHIETLAHLRPTVTTDEVWAMVGDWTVKEPRALGALMREAARRGWIVATDSYRPSERIECHRRPVRVWRSQVFDGRERVSA